MGGTVKVLTANRLADGAVVYLSPAGKWVERLRDALVMTSAAEADERLARAQDDVKARLIVEPYAIDAEPVATGVRPLRQREVIRAAGPTVRLDLGKQAEGGV